MLYISWEELRDSLEKVITEEMRDKYDKPSQKLVFDDLNHLFDQMKNAMGRAIHKTSIEDDCK